MEEQITTIIFYPNASYRLKHLSLKIGKYHKIKGLNGERDTFTAPNESKERKKCRKTQVKKIEPFQISEAWVGEGREEVKLCLS